MQVSDSIAAVAFETAADWECWLAEHHTRHRDVWLKIAKKRSKVTSVTLPEALDVALCFGWIDSTRRAFDEDHYLQRYSVRTPRSSWSQVNVAKADALIAAGRMRQPGFAAILDAKADGRWSAAYEPQRSFTVPADLMAALAADKQALDRFRGLNTTRRYNLILPILKARTPAARAARLRRVTATLAEQGRQG